jgi:hypothetical protein
LLARLTLALLSTCLVVGCTAAEGNLQTYWGPDGSADGRTTLTPGEELVVTGLVTRLITTSEPQLDFVEVVLVEAETPVTCSMYGVWMEQVAALQEYAADIYALSEDQRPEDWQSYVCQELAGAARDVFGGDGSYRALHALLNATGGGPEGDLFRPASPGDTSGLYLGGNLAASQRDRYVGRLYERGKHASGILPSSADSSWEGSDISPIDGCGGVISVLARELDEARTTYPDSNSLALQAATHRWYHHADDRSSVGLDEGGQLAVGITFPNWQEAATTDGVLSATVFQSVARAPDTFPYEYVLLTTKGRQIEVEACTRLNDFAPLVWPEVEQLRAEPIAAGDDDDSAQ